MSDAMDFYLKKNSWEPCAYGESSLGIIKRFRNWETFPYTMILFKSLNIRNIVPFNSFTGFTAMHDVAKRYDENYTVVWNWYVDDTQFREDVRSYFDAAKVMGLMTSLDHLQNLDQRAAGSKVETIYLK